MSAERRVGAAREVVWAALNDPEVLRESIPGCESIEMVDDQAFAAAVIAKVGPMKARFSGKLQLSDIDPPNRYRISGEGQAGSAGFARGSAEVSLEADGDGTLLKYQVDASVGGRLAQIGSRLVDAAARKMADDFFSRFDALVSSNQTRTAEAAGTSEATPMAGLSPIVWVPILIVAATALTVGISYW
jgi:hypothetical protein